MAENPFNIPDQDPVQQTAPGTQPWNLDNGPQQPGRLNKDWAEKAVHGAEAVFNKMGNVLQNRMVFGKSVASFVMGAAAPGALRMGAKEVAKSVVAWSGLAGAVGGGLTGTMAAGAFVGAVSGAVVEYARQVNKNLDTRLAGVNEADPAVVGRKNAFLRKMKELRRTEVLKPNDYRKLGKAALFGAVAGAGAGALVENIPGLSEFIKEHTGALGSALKNLGEASGGVAGGAGDALGVVGKTAGDLAGDAGHIAGDAAGGIGHTTGELLGGAGESVGQVPVVGGAKDLAGGVLHDIGDVAGGVGGAIGHTFDDLKHAVGLDGQDGPPQGDISDGASAAGRGIPLPSEPETILPDPYAAGEVAGAGAGAAAAAAAEAAEQASTHAQSSLESFGNSIPLTPGSNPWEVSQNILSQMGIAHPSPEQIMQLDKVISQENGISVPEWGIKGSIDAHNLPVGFKINLTDTVKRAALALANK